MKYENIKKAVFIDRPNRFIANIELDGRREVCHVKNTGRCRELLVPGVEIYVQHFDSAARKTKYDLISVRKGERLINMDSQAPNKVFYEWTAEGYFLENLKVIRPETVYENSRFDFYLEAGEKRIFVEIKGVTLEENGVVLFPDAPTERGVKHLNELIRCVRDGYEAYAVFIVQMSDVEYFTPNRATHPEFADALLHASENGVHVLAYSCDVAENELRIAQSVPIKL